MKEIAYLIQAVLIAAWWLGLSLSDRFFDAFQFAGIGATAFWSFFAPDILVIGVLSLVRAYRDRAALELVILGGFAYGALYCLNATLLTSSGFLATGSMMIGLCYNIFLCFNESLFRQSKSTSLVVNGLKTFIQVVCIWGLALGIIPFVLLDAFGAATIPRIGVASVAGACLFVGFSALGIGSACYMVAQGGGTPLPLDQTNQLVVAGPYKYVRNPMAIAGIGQGLSIALIFLSLPILIYALTGAVIWHLVVRPSEERNMTLRFGQPYLEYQKRVACWLPTVDPGRRQQGDDA